MSILNRFKEIMAANINALLDNLEDPGKMANQLLLTYEKYLVQTKAETATVIAEEIAAKRECERIAKKASDLLKCSEKAVLSGNDDDARKLLVEKDRILMDELNRAEEYYATAREKTVMMKALHDKLESDIHVLEVRRHAVKADIAIAKAGERVSKVADSVYGMTASLRSLDHWEEKARFRRDRATAMLMMNPYINEAMNETGSIRALVDKYSDKAGANVEAELSEMKLRLGVVEDNKTDSAA